MSNYAPTKDNEWIELLVRSNNPKALQIQAAGHYKTTTTSFWANDKDDLGNENRTVAEAVLNKPINIKTGTATNGFEVIIDIKIIDGDKVYYAYTSFKPNKPNK